MKPTLSLFLAILFSSCSANHSNDGTYFGNVGFTLVTYVVEGNDVTIYGGSQFHTESIENTKEYIRLLSNGTVLLVKMDSITNEKYLVEARPFLPAKLRFASVRTDLSSTEILNALNEGYKAIK